MDYTVIFGAIADVFKTALPVGIAFILVEKLTHMFFYFAFPKFFK